MKRLLVLGLGLALFGAACGASDSRGIGDAPVGTRHEAPREIWVMPDRYSNLAVTCILTDMVIVTTDNAPPVVVKDAAYCKR